MTLQRLHSRLNGFPRRWVTVESLVLGCLLPVAVLLAKLALFVVILLHSPLRHRLFQVQYCSVDLLQHCGTQVGARQQIEQYAARKLFYRQVVHSMVDWYYDHVGLTRFSEVVILAGRPVVVVGLVGLSDSADREETML